MEFTASLKVMASSNSFPLANIMEGAVTSVFVVSTVQSLVISVLRTTPAIFFIVAPTRVSRIDCPTGNIFEGIKCPSFEIGSYLTEPGKLIPPETVVNVIELVVTVLGSKLSSKVNTKSFVGAVRVVPGVGNIPTNEGAEESALGPVVNFET